MSSTVLLHGQRLQGSMVNITQVQACLGQRNVQGGRIPRQWNDRTATEFKRGSTRPPPWLCFSSYPEGLTPPGARALSGRRGRSIPPSRRRRRHTERKWMKCLENVISCADGTERRALIQFV